MLIGMHKEAQAVGMVVAVVPAITLVAVAVVVPFV
jgi:hypothetical protein